MDETFFDEVVESFERKGIENIRVPRNKALIEIGKKIKDINGLLLIENFEVLEKYLAIFDDVIENISNAKTIYGIKVFKNYFDCEYSNMLKEFRNEYLKKYNIYSSDIEVSDNDTLSLLYNKLNSLRF